MLYRCEKDAFRLTIRHRHRVVMRLKAATFRPLPTTKLIFHGHYMTRAQNTHVKFNPSTIASENCFHFVHIIWHLCWNDDDKPIELPLPGCVYAATMAIVWSICLCGAETAGGFRRTQRDVMMDDFIMAPLSRWSKAAKQKSNDYMK